MKSVVVCGSKKYKDEIFAFCDALEKAGVVVFRPNIGQPMFEHESVGTEHQTRMIFVGLTLEHFEMIRKSDVCFVFNKDNYVGTSVTLEMGFAQALGKPMYALTDRTGDPCRDALIDGVTATPAELLKKL